MIDEFKIRLKDAYKNSARWNRILRLFKADQSTEDLTFRLRDDLLYYIFEEDKRERLCILTSMHKKIFELAYNKHNHAEFHRIYDKVNAFLYICKLSRRLRLYLLHCSQCQLNQTKRHSLYESLRSIQSRVISFHIIAINFVMTLLITIDKNYDCLLTITNKFSKRILLLSRKKT